MITDLNIMPPELLADGNELFSIIAQINLAGGFVWGMEVIRGRNALYRLRIAWPRPTASPANFDCAGRVSLPADDRCVLGRPDATPANPYKKSNLFDQKGSPPSAVAVRRSVTRGIF